MPNQHPPVTPEVIAEWSKALDEGMSYQHIGEQFKVSKATVRKYLPGRGWTRKQITSHGVLVRQHNEKMRKANYV
jgi:response regulator of citrate/malate metabolism